MHGHAGALKILTELRKKFSTPSLAIDVHFVTNCQTCLKAKPDKIFHGYKNYHRKNGFKNTTTFSNSKNYTDAWPQILINNYLTLKSIHFPNFDNKTDVTSFRSQDFIISLLTFGDNIISI